MSLININFPGQNAYLHPTFCEDYGACGDHWQNVQNSGAKFIRVGGKSYDKCLRNALGTPNDYDKFEDSGMFNYNFTPIVQLSYYETDTQIWTNPEDAANHLLESVVRPLYDEKGIRYFIIGNEPNMAEGPYKDAIDNGDYEDTAQEIHAYISAISTAIRAEYNDVFLLGPELTYYDEELINNLTQGEYNILQYIDAFTFHYYPFNSLENDAVDYEIAATRDNIVNVLRGINPVFFANGNPVTSLETRLDSLSNIIAASDYPNVKIAITEANLCYRNNINDNSETGNGTNGFLCGQFWAELMAVGMSKDVTAINFWSVIEGTDQDSYATDIGYISSQPGNQFKSTYYHFQWMALNFKGRFKWGNITAVNPHKVKAFASKNADGIAVMVMNQDLSGVSLSTTRPLKIRLKKKRISAGGDDDVKITFNFKIDEFYEDQINGEETLLILFDAAGNFLQKYTYNIADYIADVDPN